MNPIRGIINDGKVVFSAPTELPEGTEVEVIPLGRESVLEDDDPCTANEIGRTLAAVDVIEAFELSDEEAAAIAVDRQARKEWEKAHFDEHAERLREMWE